MAFCRRCGTDIPEGKSFCPNCGLEANPKMEPERIYVPEYDHTFEFEMADIKEHKVYAMLSCLLGIVGALITLLGVNDSKYAMFYAKEAFKCTVIEILVTFIAAVLCWTIIVPILAALLEIVIWIVRIIGFFNVCHDQAKEFEIIRAFKFLK